MPTEYRPFSSNKPLPVTSKHYLYAAVISFFIPFLAFLLQTAWTFYAHPTRLYQACLYDADLSSPLFWIGSGTLGLLIFLVLALVMKNPRRCWIVATIFLLGLTWALILLRNSVVYK